MADFTNNEQRTAKVLEGVFKALSTKIDEARETVSREVRFTSA